MFYCTLYTRLNFDSESNEFRLKDHATESESEEPEIVSDPDETETVGNKQEETMNNGNDKALGRHLGRAAIPCGLVGLVVAGPTVAVV
jgi:hypothetical protein